MGSPRAKPAPLILYHGAFISSILFERVIPFLSKSYDAIAPDLPGHGESKETTTDLVQYTLDLLKKLKLASAHFLGSSFGGGVLIRFAAAHPEKVRRLILVSPTGIPAVESDKVVRSYPKPKDLFEAFQQSIHDRSLATRELYRKIARLQRISAEYMARYRAALPKGYRERGWIPEMKQIQAPTLVIWGDEDRIVPFEFAERLTGYIPGAELRVMKGAGHFPYFERPEEFAWLIDPRS